MKTTNDFVIRKGVLKEYKGPGGIVVIPEGVTDIGQPLWGNNRIDALVLPESLKSIERKNLPKWTLKSITIPRNMQEIKEIDVQESIEVSPDNMYFSVQEGVLFDKNKTKLISCPQKKEGAYEIPDSVTCICDSAFIGCSNLTSVTIPDSVTSIGNDAFCACSGLTSVTIPNGVTSIGRGTFWGCSNLHTISIPDSITSIGELAFRECICLTSMTIPNSMTSINGNLFSGCKSLKSVKIPDHISSIGEGAFEGCSSLTSITIPNCVTKIGASAFRKCSSLTSITIPNGLTAIHNGTFTGCDSIKQFVIPDSVESIAEGAFDSKPIIMISDILRLPLRYRPQAVIGFAEGGGGKETPGFSGCSKYIKDNAAKLVDTAMTHPALLALMYRESLITPKNVRLYVESAQKSGNAEMIAMMLDYQTNKVSDKQKESVEKREEKVQETITDRMLARQGKAGIKGLSIAVTGKLETFENREKLKTFIDKKGGKLASSLTAKVDYLIMNAPESDSAKAKKAQELGIEIITERCFNELTGRLFVKKGKMIVLYSGSSSRVIIPENVVMIADEAFSNYSSLTDITIPNSVVRIYKGAFSGCPNLTIHAPAGSYAEQYAKENNIPFMAE